MIRACKAAVNFPIDIVNGASLRHFSDVFHVEGLCPGPVKEKNREQTCRQQKKQRYLPAVTNEDVCALFFRTSNASEHFHWLQNRQSSRTSCCAKQNAGRINVESVAPAA